MYVDSLSLIFILTLASMQFASLASDRELWHKPFVWRVFIDKLLWPFLAASAVTVILVNPMKFDWLQRITLGIAVVSFAVFLAHTVNKTKINDDYISVRQHGAVIVTGWPGPLFFVYGSENSENPFIAPVGVGFYR
jgi:hypothetical protein